MLYFNTRSTQQLKNLRKPPFNFSRPDEVKQLRKNLCVRLPHLLPMQADEYVCTLSSGETMLGKGEEKTGEVYYSKQPIFNARRETDNRVTVNRFSYSKKVNEAAPKVRFNYSRLNNHYVPKWALDVEGNLPNNCLVSLCSSVNMSNIPKQKPSNAFHFLQNRNILRDDFQKLLSLGLYVVVPDLSVEVAQYLDCTTAVLPKAICVRPHAGNRFTTTVDLSCLGCQTSTQKVYGNPCVTEVHSLISVLVKILVTVKVDGKEPWLDQFFVGNLEGFLLLFPRTDCGTFWCVTAAFYRDNRNGRLKCSMLDENGVHTTTFMSPL